MSALRSRRAQLVVEVQQASATAPDANEFAEVRHNIEMAVTDRRRGAPQRGGPGTCAGVRHVVCDGTSDAARSPGGLYEHLAAQYHLRPGPVPAKRCSSGPLKTAAQRRNPLLP